MLERLHADPKLRMIPVIMISAIEEIESVIRCIEFGAEDYLPKPFNPTLLRARVKASLEKKGAAGDRKPAKRVEGKVAAKAVALKRKAASR